MVDVCSRGDVTDIYAGVVVPDAAEPSFGENMPPNLHRIATIAGQDIPLLSDC